MAKPPRVEIEPITASVDLRSMEPRGYALKMPLSQEIEVWLNIFGGAPTHDQFNLLKDFIDKMDAALNGPQPPKAVVVAIAPAVNPRRGVLRTAKRLFKPINDELREEILAYARSEPNMHLAMIIRHFSTRASVTQVRDLLIKAGIHKPQQRGFINKGEIQ